MDKINNNPGNDTGKCSCGCEHDHEHSHHDNLYGRSNEVPAVFSHVIQAEFRSEITAGELKNRLVEWIENLKQWIMQNKYFTGHIKVFADNGEGFNLWLSTTGRDINIKDSSENPLLGICRCTVNMAAIIIGPDEQALKQITLDEFQKCVSKFVQTPE